VCGHFSRAVIHGAGPSTVELDSEIAAIEKEIASADAEAARYSDGLISVQTPRGYRGDLGIRVGPCIFGIRDQPVDRPPLDLVGRPRSLISGSLSRAGARTRRGIRDTPSCRAEPLPIDRHGFRGA
jgi:hypothetical protein